jgi:hypothetical protein
MKFFFLLAVVCGTSVGAFASDTASVISCYDQAMYKLSINAHGASNLCSKVNSPADTTAVISCYDHAMKELSIDIEGAGILCSSVTK